ncbi:hypothetical protein Gasu2_28070 [Galdieria sulphuraria]|nr:hypothetical protein Gasu2_28070 [Galdieria sulphuraria]
MNNDFGRKRTSPSERNVSCLFVVYISVICVVVCIFLVVRTMRKGNSPVNWLQVEKKLRFIDSRFNASVYVIDLSGDLNNSPFFKLSRSAWSLFSKNRIDYVAFFYKEPPFLSNSWLWNRTDNLWLLSTQLYFGKLRNKIGSDAEEIGSRNLSRYCRNPKLLNMRIFPLFDNALRQARSEFARLLEKQRNELLRAF